MTTSYSFIHRLSITTVTNSTTGNYVICTALVAYSGHTYRFHPHTKKLKPPTFVVVCSIKRVTAKKLLPSFHLNGHTLGFHPQNQKLEPPCIHVAQ